MKNYAIILAAGDGKRLGSKIPKCFIKINGKEIYKYSLETFLSNKKFKKIVLVVPKGYIDKIKYEDKKLIVVEGGSNRNKSFENGLYPLLEKAKSLDKVLVHDAARPFITQQSLNIMLKSNLDVGSFAFFGRKNKTDLHIDKYNILTPQFFRIWFYVSLNKKNKHGKDMFTYFNVVPTKQNLIIVKDINSFYKITYKNDLYKKYNNINR